MSEAPTPPHVTDEELVLHYYEESLPPERARVTAHLAACDACRALDHDLRAVLTLVDTAPGADPVLAIDSIRADVVALRKTPCD